MACAGCGGRRMQLPTSTRHGSVTSMPPAGRTAGTVNPANLRPVNVQQKYGGKPVAQPAQPYRRPPERTA